MSDRMRIGIIGCGDILPAYLTGLRRFPKLVEVVRCADVIEPLARSTAERYAIPRWGSVEELWSDAEVEAVVSLTPQRFHASIVETAASRGKHIFTEKPLATSIEDGQAAIRAAMEHGIVVGAAPDTFMGAGAQTARRVIDRGDIGEPIACVAFSTYSRLERWHPNPQIFFNPGGGPVLDVGPYFIAALVNMLGPISMVSGMSRIGGNPRRVINDEGDSVEIPVNVDTHASASLRFASGVVGTLVASFDIWSHELPHIEVYGTEGTVAVPHPNYYDGETRVRLHDDDDWRPVDHVLPAVVRSPREKIRGLGVIDLAQTLNGGEQRTTAELALHTLETLASIQHSSDDGRVITLESSTRRPASVSSDDYADWGLEAGDPGNH